MQNPHYFKIAENFSKTPGPRYIKEGVFSAELLLKDGFRKLYFDALDKGYKITVDLDDTAGYATSFLEGTFGELARESDPEKVLNHFIFISHKRPWYIDEIKEYINDVKKNK